MDSTQFVDTPAMAIPLPLIENAASNAANGNTVEPTSPVPCYLFELPWEVRNKILRYLLYCDKPLRLLERGFDDDGDQGGDDGDDPCEDDKDENDQSEKDLDEECPEGYYKNYAFSSQVMRTCRHLYDECKLVLGSNTIGIDLCRYSGDGWQWAVAGHCQEACNITGMRLDEKVKKMFHQTEKFHIFMDLQDLDEPLDYSDWRRQYMRFPAPQICKRLVEKQNLKQCRIDVTIERFANEEAYLYKPEGGFLYPPEEMECSFLASFQMLRCKDFSIVGCYEDTAYELGLSILADEPVRNIWTMYDALKTFVKGSSCLRDDSDHSQCGLSCSDTKYCSPLRLALLDVLPEYPISDDFYSCEFYWDLVKETVIWGNVHNFVRYRSSLLEVIDNNQAKKKREFLELDFACKGLVE